VQTCRAPFCHAVCNAQGSHQMREPRIRYVSVTNRQVQVATPKINGRFFAADCVTPGRRRPFPAQRHRYANQRAIASLTLLLGELSVWTC
jgi:hypothetical protein